MQIFTPEELEEDILTDLLEEINELYEASEQTLIELELRPEDNELQRSLFRSVHTIKGDLGLVNFKPMIPLLQHVEDLLDYLRKGQVSYTSTMSDLVLLAMDKVKIFVSACFNEGKAEYDADVIARLIDKVKQISPENVGLHEALLAEAVNILNPSMGQDNTSPDDSVHEHSASQISTALPSTGIPKDISRPNQADILFFREMMKPIEKRSNYWEGRSDRISKLAFYINQIAGSPIDNEQLAVACYVHDFGMAFMPLKLIHKKEKLTDADFNLIRSHVYKSSRLLEHLDHWNDARNIVMQHHERIDGSGYPLGVKGEDICDGAKLLAIIDSFEAMTQNRAHKDNKRQMKKRAVIEINKSPVGQYCPRWLGYFNAGMSNLLKVQ